LINYENRQCGLQAAKILMEAGGIIKSGAARHPLLPLDTATRDGLVQIACQLDPLVLRWAA
jgi:4-hydroxy-tetrahydrodipicolinate synthase